MRVALVWDDEAESVVRWQFAGVIGITDYIIPMNETAARAIMSGHEAIDCVVNIGWRMPFPNRPFRYLHQAIMAAPPVLRLIVIASANPLARLIIRLFLLRPHPDLAGRGVRLVNSLDRARALIEQARKDRATA